MKRTLKKPFDPAAQLTSQLFETGTTPNFQTEFFREKKQPLLLVFKPVSLSVCACEIVQKNIRKSFIILQPVTPPNLYKLCDDGV